MKPIRVIFALITLNSKQITMVSLSSQIFLLSSWTNNLIDESRAATMPNGGSNGRKHGAATAVDDDSEKTRSSRVTTMALVISRSSSKSLITFLKRPTFQRNCWNSSRFSIHRCRLSFCRHRLGWKLSFCRWKLSYCRWKLGLPNRRLLQPGCLNHEVSSKTCSA